MLHLDCRTALTWVVIYEIAKDALRPLLKGRPGMAGELNEGLATRQLAHRTILDQRSDKEQQGNSNRVLANVRRVFSLH
jgi:CRP-like cAMP-binding protein